AATRRGACTRFYAACRGLRQGGSCPRLAVATKNRRALLVRSGLRRPERLAVARVQLARVLIGGTRGWVHRTNPFSSTSTASTQGVARPRGTRQFRCS